MSNIQNLHDVNAPSALDQSILLQNHQIKKEHSDLLKKVSRLEKACAGFESTITGLNSTITNIVKHDGEHENVLKRLQKLEEALQCSNERLSPKATTTELMTKLERLEQSLENQDRASVTRDENALETRFENLEASFQGLTRAFNEKVKQAQSFAKQLAQCRSANNETDKWVHKTLMKHVSLHDSHLIQLREDLNAVTKQVAENASKPAAPVRSGLVSKTDLSDPRVLRPKLASMDAAITSSHHRIDRVIADLRGAEDQIQNLITSNQTIGMHIQGLWANRQGANATLAAPNPMQDPYTPAPVYYYDYEQEQSQPLGAFSPSVSEASEGNKTPFDGNTPARPGNLFDPSSQHSRMSTADFERLGRRRSLSPCSGHVVARRSARKAARAAKLKAELQQKCEEALGVETGDDDTQADPAATIVEQGRARVFQNHVAPTGNAQPPDQIQRDVAQAIPEKRPVASSSPKVQRKRRIIPQYTNDTEFNQMQDGASPSKNHGDNV